MYDSCPYCGSTERKHDWRACGQEQYDNDRLVNSDYPTDDF